MTTPKQTIPMKEVRNDRKTTITHDFIPNHKYEVIVRAIGENGQQQAIENSARNTIVVQGKSGSPSAPSGLVAAGYLNDIYLTWTNPANYDFSHVEIWRSSTNDISTATKIAQTSGITYIDVVGEPDITRYYWIRAVNTSQGVSDYHPDTTEGVSGTSELINSLWIGSINADTITAGTLTGRTVQTAASGQRMVMDSSDNTYRMYDVDGVNVLIMDDNLGDSSEPGIKMLDGTVLSYDTFADPHWTGNFTKGACSFWNHDADIGAWYRTLVNTRGLTVYYKLGSATLEERVRIDRNGIVLTYGNITLSAAGATVDGVDVSTHASRHQDGGADEISVAGLSGLLATAQTPAAHNLGDHSVAAGNLTKYIKCNDGSLILEWITPANLLIDIGGAAAVHTHNTGDITDIPAYGGADAGKVLTVNGSGTGLIWV